MSSVHSPYTIRQGIMFEYQPHVVIITNLCEIIAFETTDQSL